ncbi:MAG: glutamate racemase [Elusimicrobiaceae bacterium]|nr:glutamate racemase [Elusimicrobiaceae bacterium]
MKEHPIGIFDSGLGGLTVLKALRKALPHEHFIYFGDSANVPYGAKSKQTVTKLSCTIASFLQEQGVKLIVVACNTASAQALSSLQKQCRVPVLGVIEPGAQKAVAMTRNHRIALLGTEGTVRSRAYEKAILRLSKKEKVFPQAAPLFVPLVEENFARQPATRLIAQHYATPLLRKQIDTVILGCTHYPVLKPLLTEIFGPSVHLVDPSDTLAAQVKDYLSASHQAQSTGKGSVCFYVSDDPARFKRLAQQVLRAPVTRVHLKKLNV